MLVHINCIHSRKAIICLGSILAIQHGTVFGTLNALILD